jgi:hypothetical protein
MEIQGYVIDESTGNGIPGASVTITDADAKPTGEGTIADNQGFFKYNGTTVESGGYMLFTSVGYKSTLVPYGIVLEVGNAQLEQDATVLPDPVITAHLKSKNGGLWAAGVLLALSYASQPRGRRVGAAETAPARSMPDFSRYVVPVGVVVLGYAIVKPILTKLGVFDSSEDKARKAAAAAAAEQQKTAAANATGSQNFSDNDLKSIGTQMLNATKGWTYDYTTLSRVMAYFSGFTHIDAVKFLGFFATSAGKTLYQWYEDDFENAWVTHISQFFSSGNGGLYKQNYLNMGVADSVFGSLDADTLMGGLGTVVSYPYKVAGTSKQ